MGEELAALLYKTTSNTLKFSVVRVTEYEYSLDSAISVVTKSIADPKIKVAKGKILVSYVANGKAWFTWSDKLVEED